MVNQSWRILDLLSRGDSLFTSTAHPQFNHHLGNEFYVISKQLPVYLGIKSHQFSALFFLTPYGSITNSTCTPPEIKHGTWTSPITKKAHHFWLQTSSFSRRFWYPSPTLPPEDSDPSVRPDFQLLEEELRRLWSSATLPWAAQISAPKKNFQGPKWPPLFLRAEQQQNIRRVLFFCCLARMF